MTQMQRYHIAFFTAVALIVVLFAVLMVTGYHAARDQALVTARNMAGTLSGTIEEILARTESDLNVFVPQMTEDDLAGRTPDDRRADLEARLGYHLKNFPAVEDYRIFGADGRLLFGAGSSGPHALLDVSDRPWFMALKDQPDRSVIVSHIPVSRVTGRPILNLAVPIRDTEGIFRGALSASLNTDYFQGLIDSFELGREGLVAVRSLDDYSLLLRRPRLTDPNADIMRGADLARRMLTGSPSGEGDFDSPIDHIFRRYAFHALPHHRLTIVVAVAGDDYLAPWRKQSLWLGSLALVLILAVTGAYLAQLKSQTTLRVFNDLLLKGERRLFSETQRLQTILRSASDGFHILDEDGRLVMASDSFYAMHGLSAETAIGLHVSTWNAHWTEVEFRQRIADLLQAQDGMQFETHHRRADGSGFDVEIATRGILLEDRPHLFCSARDISERKLAERLLKDSEDRLRSLIEGTTDWIWETDADHRLTMASSYAAELFGRPVEALIGRRRWDVAWEHHIDPKIWESHLRDLSERKSFREFRYWISAADGKAHWLNIRGSPFYGEDGTFLGYRGSGTDVTDEAETAARMKLLTSLVEQSPIAAMITSPDFIVRYANPQAQRLLSPADEPLIGKDFWTLDNGTVSHDRVEEIRTMLATQTPWSGEVPNRQNDGQIRWYHLACNFILDDFGLIQHYVVLVEDITRRKADEEKILRANRALDGQAQKLKSVNAELEQFAYVASHDLRQPLRMIYSYLDLIQSGLGPALTPELKTYLDFAMGGAKRLDQLILDLLEYSRTGRNMVLAPVDTASVIKECIVNLSVAISETQADIRVPDTLPVLQSSRVDLIRLFQNLIGNAIKYHAPDRPPRIEIACQDQGADWLFSVTDNGIGIDPGSYDRIFQVFQRLVTRDQYEGTGIGLAVCKKVVDRCNGRIWVRSEPGTGSTFFVSLPKDGGAEAGPAPQPNLP